MKNLTDSERITRLEEMVLTLSETITRLKEVVNTGSYEYDLFDVNRILNREVSSFKAENYE